MGGIVIWTTAKAFQLEHDARVKAEAVISVVERENVALHTTMDWMKMRLTQLEQERAQLIYRYMGVKITVPEIEDEQPQNGVNHTLNDAAALFSDMGDQAAAELGVEWDEDGRVKYTK
jgi:hypothetical protein